MKGLHKNSLRKVDNPHQWMIDDARMELNQQIRAEIEQLKDEYTDIAIDSHYGTVNANHVVDDLEQLLSCLSDLEKEEKPMEHKDIDAEIGHWLDRLDDKYCMLVNHYSIQDIKDTARHFYELGRSEKPNNHLEQPVCERLEEEIERYIPTSLAVKFPTTDIETIKSDIRYIARHFAQWQKSQMIKEEGKHV